VATSGAERSQPAMFMGLAVFAVAGVGLL
jgi:hypothetical protein